MNALITENLSTLALAVQNKSTSGRGSSKKIDLYGIKKLRELILELAVRGKLVPQNPEDEPASKLLERIEVERERLVNEKKIKKPKKLPEVTEEEKPYSLPQGWQWARLGCLANSIRGVSYKKHEVSEVFQEGYIELLRANNINVTLNRETVIYVPTRLVRAEQVITAGDLLIAMSSGSPDLVGKAAQASNEINATFGAFCGLVRPYSVEIERFLGFFCKTPSYRRQTKSVGKGIGIKNLNKQGLDNLLIPLPPIQEQHRIVTKVDELMALCDQIEQQTEASLSAHATLVENLLATLTSSANAEALEQNWQRIASHFTTLFTTAESIDQLKQTILQLAVMGKLVPQDPNDEPAAKLLERIAAEKAQLVKEGKIKKQKLLLPVAEDEKPFELPEGWEWCRFGELFKSFSNGLYKPAKFYTDTGLISLRMYNIQDGEIDFHNAKRVDLQQEELEQFKLEADDLLINRVNSKELVGKTAIIPEFEEPLVYESMNMRAKPFIPLLDAKYLNLFMQSSLAKETLFGHAKEAIGQASINQSQVCSMLTPLPPKSEQTRIVTKVDQLMTLCDQIKTHLQHQQQTRLHLADAMVDRALA